MDFYRSQQNIKWINWPNKKKKYPNKNKKQTKLEKSRNRINEEAKILTESKEVINLTNHIIPPEATVVLGKGLGFVTNPKPNHEMERLDARLVVNRIAAASNTIDTGSRVNNNINKYSSIAVKDYHCPKTVKDPIANLVIQRIENIMNYSTPTYSTPKPNLSPLEQQGLLWLQKKTQNLDIVICEADKGGAKLIVTPETIDQKIKEKVENPNLYVSSDIDPRPPLYNELIKIWASGKILKFVDEYTAHNIVGLTNNNNKSTASHFKPGIPYFLPSLKIHKIKDPNDLKPGVDVPARVITALQNGVTKRSDVYLATNILKYIENDFCTDLVEDTTKTLIWLDNINTTIEATLKKTFKCFTLDFKNLYDSLSPELVLEAMTFAIKKVRPNWKSDYVKWILDLINISMKSAIGMYKGKWYTPIEGIPTGGSLSVQLANITVFYVLWQCLYSKDDLLEHIHSMKRFIDDEVGIFKGSLRQFNTWKKYLLQGLSRYKLVIEEGAWQYAENGEYVNFLDIKFGFDFNGDLMTDLYRKETDSRSYLHYNSCHPNFVFSGIVYSQALRIRRIVNDDYKVNIHLDVLKQSFFKAKYPKKMVNNIIDKVKTMPRILHRIPRNNQAGKDNRIRVVSTHGCDNFLVDTISRTQKMLKASNIFINSNINNPYTFTKKIATPLRSKLCNSVMISIGPKYGFTTPCQKNRCLTCLMMSKNDSVVLNNKKFKTAPGNCCSSMIVYVGICNFQSCHTPYVGKTVQPFHERVNGHRSDFRRYCANPKVLDNTIDLDRYAIGIHLKKEHGLSDAKYFDQYIKVTILENCTPKDLAVKEHLWIQKAKSLFPGGMNLNSPYGLPLHYGL